MNRNERQVAMKDDIKCRKCVSLMWREKYWRKLYVEESERGKKVKVTYELNLGDIINSKNGNNSTERW